MANFLKILLIVFIIFFIFIGLPLLIIPGRFMYTIGWPFSEPLVVRMLGAAFLALGWSAWKSLRASNPKETIITIEALIVFSILGSISWLRHLLIAYYWPYLWIITIVLLVLGLIFIFIRLSLAREEP